MLWGYCIERSILPDYRTFLPPSGCSPAAIRCAARLFFSRLLQRVKRYEEPCDAGGLSNSLHSSRYLALSDQRDSIFVVVVLVAPSNVLLGNDFGLLVKLQCSMSGFLVLAGERLNLFGCNVDFPCCCLITIESADLLIDCGSILVVWVTVCGTVVTWMSERMERPSHMPMEPPSAAMNVATVHSHF